MKKDLFLLISERVSISGAAWRRRYDEEREDDEDEAVEQDLYTDFCN